MIAVIALAAYGVIFFALIKLIPITLTLPGIAGLVLTIGVAADSNIVIFERIKEEVRAGRSMASAITAGYQPWDLDDRRRQRRHPADRVHSLRAGDRRSERIRIRPWRWHDRLTADRGCLHAGAARQHELARNCCARPALLGAAGKGRRWHFDFMGASRWFFTLSGTILLIGAVALATKQLNLGIDFKSGTRVTAALVKPTTEEGVREALGTIGVNDEQVQQVTNPVFGDNVFQIETRQLGPSQVKDAEAVLSSKFGIAKSGFESTSVGPTFGEQVASSALKALIFSLLVICGYVALRFDPKFAVPVLIALFHDILITAGIYALTGKEVSSGTVAAFLTILGYSLYDTIIVFDRIRENMPRMPRAAFSQIVNRSMSEVLTRSLATSFSTLLAVGSLLVFGGATLQDFAFAMLVGIASGTYSSIFIASPVLTAWKEREPGFARRRARIAELEGRVPAFADEIDLARLGDEESDEQIAAGARAQEELRPRAVATVERPVEGDGPTGAPSTNGEPPAAALDPAAAERRERDERRRARRQQRRKHGRNR